MNSNRRFNNGDHVYFSECQMHGIIVEYTGDGFYRIEFDGDCGGGTMEWHESDIQPA
jgi:hypothetical protein